MFILAAERSINESERLDNSFVLSVAHLAKRKNLRIKKLIIDPLAAGWTTPLQEHHFRSGCGPLDAFQEAQILLDHKDCDVVLVEGIDLLKSEGRIERQKLMNIYGEISIPEAYTELAFCYLDRKGYKVSDFEKFSQVLFENFAGTAQKRGISVEIPSERFQKITRLFRAVDCANPVIDFRGRVLLGKDPALTKSLGLESKKIVEILSVNVVQGSQDGPSNINEISRFSHLREAFEKTCADSKIDFLNEFRNGRALLEVYSCFPIVPLAFLIECSFSKSIAEAVDFLRQHEVTVTGGMNLGRAPWNNPVLNATILIHQLMLEERIAFGGIHGNGGLGYKQGFALFKLRSL